MKPRKQPSTGSRLRDALAQNRANEEAEGQQREDSAADALGRSLSDWFNTVAIDVRRKVNALAAAAESGHPGAADFSYSAEDKGISLRGVEGIAMGGLAGFKTLAETCRDLDVSCTVTSGRHGYGRKSTAGKQYLHVNVNAEKPYQPVTVETPRPRGYGRSRFR